MGIQEGRWADEHSGRKLGRGAIGREVGQMSIWEGRWADGHSGRKIGR